MVKKDPLFSQDKALPSPYPGFFSLGGIFVWGAAIFVCTELTEWVKMIYSFINICSEKKTSIVHIWKCEHCKFAEISEPF